MIAGFITKILGFINRIVMARILGEEGVGLYMMAVPTFILAITLTQIGLPVAIAKFVAEAEAVNDKQKVKKILTVSLAVTSVISIILTIGIMLLTPILAKTLLTDERTYYPLMAILPVVPVIAVSSVLRGYFQGKQNMKPKRLRPSDRTNCPHYNYRYMYSIIFTLRRRICCSWCYVISRSR